jgi:hypothetical protein
MILSSEPDRSCCVWSYAVDHVVAYEAATTSWPHASATSTIGVAANWSRRATLRAARMPDAPVPLRAARSTRGTTRGNATSPASTTATTASAGESTAIGSTSSTPSAVGVSGDP